MSDRVSLNELMSALATHMPSVLRWSGAISRQLRRHNIALSGKLSGSANTDALTLADLTVQELIVGALRDCHPSLRTCRIEAEEKTGDLARFDEHGQFTIAIDPIDGTRAYRDKTGNGYANMIHLRSRETVHYSLVFIPEQGPHGSWVEVNGRQVKCGPDDPSIPAATVLKNLQPVNPSRKSNSKKIYLIGFQEHDQDHAEGLAAIGLEGYTAQTMPGCIYDHMARGEFAGSLIHSPNIYDFPVALHVARALGGDALWVHNREPIHFGETWMDDRADMLRLPGVCACSMDRGILDKLCAHARDWSPIRYAT
jgi:3'(2'), 5'-bisphosphate nucleotidase